MVMRSSTDLKEIRLKHFYILKEKSDIMVELKERKVSCLGLKSQ